MSVLKSLANAFSTFSIIPMPQFEWDERNMRYTLAFFPLIGLVIGGLITGWLWIANEAAISPIIAGAGVTIIAVALTGGIHLDGFCDVVDAQSSHAEPERKREIMKDPHIGAFAAIGASCYLIAYFAIASNLAFSPSMAIALTCAPALARVFSAMATIVFKRSGNNGMLAAFQRSASNRAVIIALLIEFVVFTAAIVFASPLVAAVCVGTAIVSLPMIYIFAQSQFGGMSGDLSGFYLCLIELAFVGIISFVI